MSTPATEMPYTAEDIYNLAAANKDIPVAFVNIQNKRGETALHLAALKGNVGAIQALLAAGAYLDATTNEGETPLHCAARNGDVDAINALLAAGADLHAKNNAGETPLHRAAWYGNSAAIQLLLGAGADLHATTNKGWTPLHCAARNGDVDAIQTLLAAGAEINAKNTYGSSPLHLAALYGNIAVIQALLIAGADLHATDNEGNTPLHFAACKGNVGVIDALLAAGADLHAITKGGRTPLCIVVNQGTVNTVQPLVAAGAGLWEYSTAQGTALPAVMLDQFNVLANALLSTPQEHSHLNFNNFSQERIAELEACLVQLATHYQDHPTDPKPLKSLCLDGLLLTPEAEAALACIIKNSKLTRLSLANTQCVVSQESLVGKAIQSNSSIRTLDLRDCFIAPAALCTLINPLIDVVYLSDTEDLAEALAKASYNLQQAVRLVMDDGTLRPQRPSLATLAATQLRDCSTQTFFSPPKAAVATASTFNPSALLSSAQPTSGDDAVAVGSAHQEIRSSLDGQTAGLAASPQAEQRSPETPAVPSTEEPTTPSCLGRLFSTCFGRGYGRI